MKFEAKISGTKVTDFKITPIFNSQFVWLTEAMEKIQNQKAMDFLLDKFRFTKGCEEKSHDWCAVLENYPNYEEEFINYFGENWLNHYIRFNH